MRIQSAGNEFKQLLDGGVQLQVAGEARSDPGILLSRGHRPKHKVSIFNTTIFLTNTKIVEDLTCIVAFVLFPQKRHRKNLLHVRLFYEDYSLMWRVATHFVASDGEIDWLGKGDTAHNTSAGQEESREETTNLPFELQPCLDRLKQQSKRPRHDARLPWLVLRQSPAGRIRAYREFTEPRARAMSERGSLINAGKRVAYLARKNDPGSARFVRGYEPDLTDGLVETSRTASDLYGGRVTKFRVLSRNRTIQYQFVRSRRFVWCNPPQTTGNSLSSFAVRPVDVNHDEQLFLPAYEYENIDDPAFRSQIPAGYAGAVCPANKFQVDIARWLNELPHIQDFKNQVLSRAS